AGWFGANLVMSPFLLLLGAAYNANWMVDAGNWFPKDIGVFVTGCVCTLWAAWVNIKGLRVYALLQRYFFWAGMICLAIVIFGLLFSSHQDFVNNLNTFMADNYHTHNAYQAVIHQGGTTNTSFTFGATMLA